MQSEKKRQVVSTVAEIEAESLEAESEEEADEECLLPNDLELLSLFFLSSSLWNSGMPARTK